MSAGFCDRILLLLISEKHHDSKYKLMQIEIILLNSMVVLTKIGQLPYIWLKLAKKNKVIITITNKICKS